MTQNPLKQFESLWKEELTQSQVKVPSACCLSTISEDGYPNSRFLALKEVNEEGFIVTGPCETRKGREIDNNPKVALTFWWPSTEMQVRIQGDAHRISPELADKHFQGRPRESQLTSWTSNQGESITNPADLISQLAEMTKRFEGKEIPRPENWGGFCIVPKRIEYLEFSDNRLHLRTLYILSRSNWEKEFLQP